MAMHDDGAEFLFAREEALTNAEQVVLGLPIECDFGSDAGMDEQVVAFAVLEAEVPHEFSWAAGTLARQSPRGTSVAMPQLASVASPPVCSQSVAAAPSPDSASSAVRS